MSIEFTNEEKIKYFDEIASYFFNKNFGLKSKSEIDLIMFGIYFRKLISENKNDENIIDFTQCSNYKMSKELGITQQKVNNLKIKYQLEHPIEYDWKEAFINLINNARYENDTHKIYINIPDPNLYIEIKNYIEESGGYVDITLNKSLLIIRVEYFIQLIIINDDENSSKKNIKKIKDNLSKNNKDEIILTKMDIAKEILRSGVDVTTIIANISPTNAFLKNIINGIKSIVRNNN